MMIIDDVQRHPRFPRRWWDRFAGARATAKRFVFSRDASVLVGQLSFECGDLVMRNRQFAIPPFDRMYVELDGEAYYDQTTRTQGPRETRDTRVGYLYDHGRLYTIAGDDHHDVLRRPLVAPATYFVASPGQPNPCRGWAPSWLSEFVEDEPGLVVDGKTPLTDRERLKWAALVMALGTSCEHIEGDADLASLEEEIRIEWAEDLEPRNLKSFAGYARNTAGDVRNFWSAVLWLNQPTKVRRVPVPASSRITRGRRVAYAAHSVIEIELGKVKTIRECFAHHERESPRRHQVRGQFRHRGGDPACSHAWPVMPDEDGHWVCGRCARVRWWVKGHVRGDATKGWVDGSYAVSRPEEKEGAA